tara:strand:- start:57 stop:290 length:234 start_codon:yes stop_codon:yes gene_type:complete
MKNFFEKQMKNDIMDLVKAKQANSKKTIADEFFKRRDSVKYVKPGRATIESDDSDEEETKLKRMDCQTKIRTLLVEK